MDLDFDLSEGVGDCSDKKRTRLRFSRTAEEGFKRLAVGAET